MKPNSSEIDFPDGPELALPSGDVTEGVVRIGNTVRRPQQPASAIIAEYLVHLEQAGFDGAPKYLGRDRQGRDVLTFLPGVVSGSPVAPWISDDQLLPEVARLVRRLHDASEGWNPSTPLPQHSGRPPLILPDGEPHLVAHRDVTPQNIVFRYSESGALIPYGLIDFDLIGWTTRSYDLANTAMHWIPLCDPQDRDDAYAGIDVAKRLRLLLDGYGYDLVSPQQLLDAAALRFRGAYCSMQWSAENLGGGWARMWKEGIGEKINRRRLWFDKVRVELAAVLARD